MTNTRTIEILLVEDSPSDAGLAVEALRDFGRRVRLNVCEDGVEAVQFLQHQGSHANAPRPDLILLDFNLPCKNGHEVLSEVKSDPELRLIPIVVLTSSKGEEDILNAYEFHANCYVAKPVDFGHFVEVLKIIVLFWTQVATLPPLSRSTPKLVRPACKFPG